MLNWEIMEGTDYLRAVGKRNVYFIRDMEWAHLGVLKYEDGPLIMHRFTDFDTISDAKKAADEMELEA